jgi:hypothetical protein
MSFSRRLTLLKWYAVIGSPKAVSISVLFDRWQPAPSTPHP